MRQEVNAMVRPRFKEVPTPPLALTRKIGNKDYKGLVRDFDTPVNELQKKYGIGLAFRLPGIIAAKGIELTVDECKAYRIKYGTAQELWNAVKHLDYIGELFDENGIDRPGDAYLDSLIFTLCCARQRDWSLVSSD